MKVSRATGLRCRVWMGAGSVPVRNEPAELLGLWTAAEPPKLLAAESGIGRKLWLLTDNVTCIEEYTDEDYVREAEARDLEIEEE